MERLQNNCHELLYSMCICPGFNVLWWHHAVDTPSTVWFNDWRVVVNSVKAPLHRAATFVPPLCDHKKWLGRSVVAWTQKVLFLCNCCSTTLVPSLNDQSCCSGSTGRAKKAEWRQNHRHGGSSGSSVVEWRHSGRHSDRSMDVIGRPKEAQWWYKEGRRVAQTDTQCSHF